MSGRTAQAGFNKTVLDSISLPKPADEMLFERYEELARPTTNLILNLRKRTKVLRTTRDFLLPKLISGEISVEAADEAAAELMEKTA
jgi:type I restriction enzyme S subunit